MSAEENWAPGEGGSAVGNANKVNILQPNRDLELNWAVDLAKNLEEYLLKICSGVIDGRDMEQDHLSLNFAEAAMLLQGSVQVYSRKVEYLYTLVLHALDFISQKRHNHLDTSAPPDQAEDYLFGSDNEKFLGLDDVPVEAKTCLHNEDIEVDNLQPFVKPPANLLVLEGDCLETNVQASELESYLLSTCNFYEDFLLLDPCDAEAVCDFLKGKNNAKECDAADRGSLLRSNARGSFCSPLVGRSGGKSHKTTPGMKQDVSANCSTEEKIISPDNKNVFSRPHVEHDSAENDRCQQDGSDAGYPNVEDYTDDDDDDPWKPLNPHEPGNLRIKPFKKGKIFRQKVRSYSRHSVFASQFPIAKLDGTINPEFADILANRLHAYANIHSSESPSLFEKLRQSLNLGDHEAYRVFSDFEDEVNDAEDEDDLPDFEQGDITLPMDTIDLNAEVSLHYEKVHGHNEQMGNGEASEKDDMDLERSLEDLCRSHMDTLLASLAESEQQTELASRVSTWKQKIEHTLEDQDSRPPFDIQLYGEKILDKLHGEADDASGMCFTEIVTGQAKNDVARTFSALLQLVNNGDVNLDKRQAKDESICYTSADPFYVRLHAIRGREEVKFRSLRKRVKSPLRKGCSKLDSCTLKLRSPVKSARQNGKVSSKGNAIRCTPESKRRRRSRLAEPVDLPSAR